MDEAEDLQFVIGTGEAVYYSVEFLLRVDIRGTVKTTTKHSTSSRYMLYTNND